MKDHDARGAEENLLLRALPVDRYAELLPYLEPVELAARQVLWQPQATIHSSSAATGLVGSGERPG